MNSSKPMKKLTSIKLLLTLRTPIILESVNAFEVRVGLRKKPNFVLPKPVIASIKSWGEWRLG